MLLQHTEVKLSNRTYICRILLDLISHIYTNIFNKRLYQYDVFYDYDNTIYWVIILVLNYTAYMGI